MKNNKNAKITVIILFVIITIFITILMFPVAKALKTEEGRIAMGERVDSFGIFAPLAFVFLQFLQIVIALVPGEPVELMGGVLFGTVGGLILCTIGSLLGTVAVFYAVQRFGKPLADAFVSEERRAKFKLLNNEKKVETAVFFLFLLPGTPKDALTYFVPLTKIHPAKFFFLSTLARVPSVITSTMMGASLGEGNWKKSVFVFCATCFVIISGLFLKNYISSRGSKNESGN